MIAATTCIPITNIFNEILSTLADQLLIPPRCLIDLPTEDHVKFLSRRTSHTKPLRVLILDSKQQMIPREHTHLESKHINKAITILLANHSRRETCVSSHSFFFSKVHMASWRKKALCRFGHGSWDGRIFCKEIIKHKREKTIKQLSQLF